MNSLCLPDSNSELSVWKVGDGLLQLAQMPQVEVPHILPIFEYANAKVPMSSVQWLSVCNASDIAEECVRPGRVSTALTLTRPPSLSRLPHRLLLI